MIIFHTYFFGLLLRFFNIKLDLTKWGTVKTVISVRSAANEQKERRDCNSFGLTQYSISHATNIVLTRVLYSRPTTLGEAWDH